MGLGLQLHPNMPQNPATYPCSWCYKTEPHDHQLGSCRGRGQERTLEECRGLALRILVYSFFHSAGYLFHRHFLPHPTPTPTAASLSGLCGALGSQQRKE